MTVWRTLLDPEDQVVLRNMAEFGAGFPHGRFEVEFRLRHADGH